MARAAVIGESLTIAGYGLAGALLCPASDGVAAAAAWRELPPDVAVVVLTPSAAGWLAGQLAARPDILVAVMPS